MIKFIIFVSRIFLVCCIFLFLNCSPSLTKLGFIEPKALSDDEILEIGNGKFNIKNGSILKLDRARFDTYLDSLKSEELSHDLYQPLQFRYYNKEGELEVLYANCDVHVEKKKGKYEWYWNKYGTFDSNPPANPLKKEYLPGTTIRDELSLYIPLSEKEISFDNNKPTIIVFWSIELDKHALELVKLSEQYVTKFDSVNVYYVNTDEQVLIN